MLARRGVIAVVAFGIVILGGVLLVVFGSKLLDRSGYNPAANAYKRARKKLHSVVDEIEAPLAGASQEDPECPICMGELFRRVPMLQAGATTTTLAGDKAGVVAARNPTAKGAPPATSEENTKTPGPMPSEEGRPFRWLADDVVSLRACQHSFHGRCLTTWFMMGRHDCPVCRAAYWGGSGEEEADTRRRRGGGVRGWRQQRRRTHMTSTGGSNVTIPSPAHQPARASAEPSAPWAEAV